MRKKQIGRVLILFVLTLFVLCACTRESEKEPYVTGGRGASSGKTGKTGVSGSGNSADTGNGADDDGTLQPLTVVYTEHESHFTLDEKGKAETVLEIGFFTLEAQGDAPEAVTAYLETFSKMQEGRVHDSVLEDSQDLYLSYSGAMGSWHDGMYWSATQVFHADRADTAVLSFAIENVSYMGGAHGARWYETYSIDAKTGDDIRFSSVVKDREALADAIYTQMKQDESFERVCEYYDGVYGTPDMGFAERYLEYYLTDDEGGVVTWTLAPEGLHVWFGDYDLGIYAMGTGDIVVPFADYPEVFAGNDYTNPGDVPAVPDGNVLQKDGGQTTVDLKEYCREEGGFLLGTFTGISGVYGTGGKMIELTEYGMYYLTGDEDEYVSVGIMRQTPGSIELYESNYDSDSDLTWEERRYGSIALIDGTEIDVTTPDGTERYYFHIEQSVAKGYIAGPKTEIALSGDDEAGGTQDEEDIADQNFRYSHGGYSEEEFMAYVYGTMWAKKGDENSAIVDLKEDGTFIALEGMDGVVEATGTYEFRADQYGPHRPFLFTMYREDGSVFTEFELVYSHDLEGEIVLFFGDVIYRQIY